MKRVRKFSGLPFLYRWIDREVGYLHVDFKGRGVAQIHVRVIDHAFMMGTAWHPGLAPDYEELVQAIEHFVVIPEGQDVRSIADRIYEAVTMSAHEGEKLYGKTDFAYMEGSPLADLKVEWWFEFYDRFAKASKKP